MNPITTAFMSVLPPGSKRTRSWINFNCPMCGDSRSRCGFLETPSGGFRIRCFNATCPLNDSATGWEPGSGLGGRPKQFFTALGGDMKDLPIAELLRLSDAYRADGSKRPVADIATKFEPCELPPGCVPLEDAADHAVDEDQIEGLSVIIDRMMDLGDEIMASHPLYWTPAQPHMMVIPFLHHGQVVGWIGRNYKPGGKRFSGKSPADYIFRQDTMERGSSRSAIVVEGVMNAIAIRGLATRNSSLTKKQEALLNAGGQKIIMLPDLNQTGLAFVDAARRNGWEVSIPNWDHGIKDVCDAVRKYGLLYTMQSVVSASTNNYVKAKAVLNTRS